MSQTKDLIARIREYEANASVARITNEKSLPVVQSILSDVDRFNFGPEDYDMKKKLIECGEQANRLTPDSITPEELEALLRNINAVQTEIIRRYSERMENYASRQSNI